MNITLWTLQALLALFFAAASGAPKLLLPYEALAANMPLPLDPNFVHLIGICEIAGALGLILPGITRIQTRLTPIAAASLTALTLCATTYQLLASQPANAVFALVMGLICASVAYGRARLAPLHDRARPQAVAQPA